MRPNHELPHTPGDHPGWKENWYVNVMDTDAGVYGMFHCSFYPNQKRASFLAVLIIDGRRHTYFNVHPFAPPISEITDGKLMFHNVEPRQAVRVTLDAPGLTADIAFQGRFPVYDYRMATGKKLFTDVLGLDDVAFDHYEQSCTAQGTVEVLSGPQKGVTKTISGLSQRDHTWGVREERLVRWHWGAAQFPDKALNYFRIVHGDAIALGGYCSTAKGNVSLSSADVEDRYPSGKTEGFPEGSRFTLTWDGGGPFAMETETLGKFLLPGGQGGFGLQELFVRYTCPDTGESGVGLAEYVLGGQVPG